MLDAPLGEAGAIAWELANGEPNAGVFGLIVSYSTQWFGRWPLNVLAWAHDQILGAHEVVDQCSTALGPVFSAPHRVVPE
jgi:hypothetical protein